MTKRLIIFVLLMAGLVSVSVLRGQYYYIAGHGKSSETNPVFTPAMVPDLVEWFKGETLTNLVINTDVRTWNDSGPNGYTLTGPATDTGRFTNTAGELLGSNFVFFSGGTRSLINALPTNKQPTTIFCLARSDNKLGTRSIFDGTNAAGRNYYAIATSNIYAYAGTVLKSSNHTFVTTGWIIHEATFNGASSSIYTNGVYLTNGNAGAQGICGTRIANDYNKNAAGFIGGIAEFILYGSAVSPNDRQLIRTYFTNKYGL